MCKNKLDLENAKLDIGYYYSNLPVCIIDAVFSIGIKYTATRNVVERFCKYMNIETFREFGSDFPNREQQYSIDKFIEFYQTYDIEFITEKIYENRCRTSTNSGILKTQAVLDFAQILQKYKINCFQDISKIINDTNFEKDIKTIKGQNSGKSLSYFFMLAGNENLIKPDRMVERFVESAINKRLSTDEIIRLFNEIIPILKSEFPILTLRALDHEIWKFESTK